MKKDLPLVNATRLYAFTDHGKLCLAWAYLSGGLHLSNSTTGSLRYSCYYDGRWSKPLTLVSGGMPWGFVEVNDVFYVLWSPRFSQSLSGVRLLEVTPSGRVIINVSVPGALIAGVTGQGYLALARPSSMRGVGSVELVNVAQQGFEVLANLSMKGLLFANAQGDLLALYNLSTLQIYRVNDLGQVTLAATSRLPSHRSLLFVMIVTQGNQDFVEEYGNFGPQPSSLDFFNVYRLADGTLLPVLEVNVTGGYYVSTGYVSALGDDVYAALEVGGFGAGGGLFSPMPLLIAVAPAGSKMTINFTSPDDVYSGRALIDIPSSNSTTTASVSATDIASIMREQPAARSPAKAYLYLAVGALIAITAAVAATLLRRGH